MQSWRTGTQKQYQTYHQRWQEFCRSRGINPLSASIENGLEFLYQQYENGLSYSGINTARSALSTVIFLPDGGSFGNHPLVSRFLKGVFESRPSLPRYKDIWDVSVVLDYLKTLPPLEELSLKDITHKTVLLVALLSGQRCQTVHALTVSGMRITNDTVHFEIAKLLKTSKPGRHQGHLEFKSYPVDERLCVVTCLRQYLKLTEPIRTGHDPLWLSYTKPFKPVSRDTVSRWIKNVLEKAGVNTKVFSAHSTRAAATSAACSNNVSINTIMDAAGWSRESTFRKFYDKPVQAVVNFGDELVSTHDCSSKQ